MTALHVEKCLSMTKRVHRRPDIENRKFSMTRQCGGPAAMSGVLIGVMIVVTSCGSTLNISPGPNGEAPYCQELVASLPVSVVGNLARATTNSSKGIRAWGDPPIYVRCGVAKPVTLSATSQLFSINGVDWYPEEFDSGTQFTSVNTGEYIEVAIPREYDPAASVLVDLGIDPA